jgi:protein TonB
LVHFFLQELIYWMNGIFRLLLKNRTVFIALILSMILHGILVYIERTSIEPSFHNGHARVSVSMTRSKVGESETKANELTQKQTVAEKIKSNRLKPTTPLKVEPEKKATLKPASGPEKLAPKFQVEPPYQKRPIKNRAENILQTDSISKELVSKPLEQKTATRRSKQSKANIENIEPANQHTGAVSVQPGATVVKVSANSDKQNLESKQAIDQKPRYQLGSALNPKPSYPSLARKRGWEGDVILGVTVAADGTIEHLTFVKSTHYSVLNHAAWETVKKQWKFGKANDSDPAIPVYIEVPISFRLQ